jgi:hypothetical protein
VIKPITIAVRIIESKFGSRENKAIKIILALLRNLLALLNKLQAAIKERIKPSETGAQSPLDSDVGNISSFTSKFEKRSSPQKRAKPDKKSFSDIAQKKASSNSASVQEKDGEKGFSEILSKKRGSLVYLVRGKDRGKAAWHYVLVDKVKLPVFLKRTQGGSLDVADYGKVLHSGWGQDPPDEIRTKIRDEFN